MTLLKRQYARPAKLSGADQSVFIVIFRFVAQSFGSRAAWKWLLYAVMPRTVCCTQGSLALIPSMSDNGLPIVDQETL